MSRGPPASMMDCSTTEKEPPWPFGAAAAPRERSHGRVGLEEIPVEVHAKILRLLDPLDVLSYASACKRFLSYADSQSLWRHQWLKLSSKTPFVFLPVATMQELGVNFRDLCKRLWNVLVAEGGEFGGLTPTKCIHCKEYTCLEGCIEESAPCSKVALDIGGKITWFVTPNFTLERHLSMLAVPKTLRCYDCDTTIARNEYVCDCAAPSEAPRFGFGPYCHNRLMSCHTALEYCSQPLSDIRFQPAISQPFCLFCDEDRVHRMLCERDMVSSTNKKLKGVSLFGRPPPPPPPDDTDSSGRLSNGYCRDTASILGANNLDLVSPLLALSHEDAFPVVRSFLSHLLKRNKMVDDLQKPNSSLTMTEPGDLSAAVRERLLRFFFEEVKVSRLCLLPKPLAVAKLFDASTCVVADSGATSTSVWVVVNGKVEPGRTQTARVGGWDVSQFLKQTLSWREGAASAPTTTTTASSLDTSAVKQKCRLLLNLAGGCSSAAARSETLHVKSQKAEDRLRKLEVTEVTMSSELYLAPEMMYAALDLPGMVVEATRDLPRHLVKECFSRILITGGNTDLQGFAQRLASDLRERLPEHSPIIDVQPYPTGNHSWNTVMGANAVRVPPPYENILQLYEPGCPLWMTREEYITFGGHQLAACDPGVREG